ncbi:MAG: hypothetical protein NDJ72_05170 [Elusimicrobia bacterium]|nr:hypothetical protein [Elusimicrobiota bacterium]
MSNIIETAKQKQCSTWTCPCGAPRKPWRAVCTRCANRNRKRHAELAPEAKLRANARSYLNQYVRRGAVVKQPCADCGATEVEAHHGDYSRPLDVTWLCADCHKRRHGIVVVRRPKPPVYRRKSDSLRAFYAQLRREGTSVAKVAANALVARSGLSLVLNGHRSGIYTWQRVLPVLSPDARRLLLICHPAADTGNAGIPQPKRTMVRRTGKPPALYEFYRALHARGETTTALAARLHVSGSVVRKLFGRLARRSGPTWAALQAQLTPGERELLAQADASPAWSAAQEAKRPKWSGAKAAALAAAGAEASP